VLAGLTAAGSPLHLQGVSVSRPAEVQQVKVAALATATLEHLGLELQVDPASVRVDDRFTGPGYGLVTSEGGEAIRVAALDEALVLDPVYTGKAMAGLIGHTREGKLKSTDVAVFVHTGGSPALFACAAETAESVS
jgi:D-cysteine desulfhydrase